MTPYTAIVIAHNQPRQLLAALAALSVHAKPAEILVIDNGSSANLSSIVALSRTQARIIRFDDHRSFGAASNAGIDAAAHEVVLLIHSDVLLESDPQPTLNRFTSDQTLGVVGGKLFQPGNEPRRVAHTGYKTSRGRINPRLTSQSKWDTFHEQRDVAAVSTACMGLRRLDIRFDERYWFCLEDVDLCHQYSQQGMQILFSPEMTALHLEHGGVNDRRKEAIWAHRFIASRLLYHDRWSSMHSLAQHPLQPAVRGEEARIYLEDTDAMLERCYPMAVQ